MHSDNGRLENLYAIITLCDSFALHVHLYTIPPYQRQAAICRKRQEKEMNTIRDILDTKRKTYADDEEPGKRGRRRKTPCCAHVYTSMANFFFLTTKEKRDARIQGPAFFFACSLPHPMQALCQSTNPKRPLSFHTFPRFASPPSDTHAVIKCGHHTLMSLLIPTSSSLSVHLIHARYPYIRLYHAHR